MKKIIIDAISSGKMVTVHFQSGTIAYDELCDIQPEDDNFIGFSYARSDWYVNLSEVTSISIK